MTRSYAVSGSFVGQFYPRRTVLSRLFVLVHGTVGLFLYRKDILP